MHKQIPLILVFMTAFLLQGCSPSEPESPELVLALSDPMQLGVAEAASLIREGRITSTQLIQVSIAQAERNPDLNALITLAADSALKASAAADADFAAGIIRGPLHGVPLVIKDNIHVANLPNSAGTPALRNFTPAQHAPIVQALVDAGAIILAKANMHELAMGISGYNEAFVTQLPAGVRNPYDTTRFAGGSSSGTAAAIAAGIVPGGLGTDTGGSVRIPAALTGGAGLRPTFGRYAANGITPLDSARDTAGPMARTVVDVALLDAVITGTEIVTPAPLQGVRLGILASRYADLDADTRQVADTTLALLAAAGVELVDVDMPDLQALADAAGAAGRYLTRNSLSEYLDRYQVGLDLADIQQQISDESLRNSFASRLSPMPLPELPALDGVNKEDPDAVRAALLEVRARLARYYQEIFERYEIEAIIFPTTPWVAVTQGPEGNTRDIFLVFVRNTEPASHAGLPGLSIPGGLGHHTGMPVGIELDGLPGSDARILALGLAIEALIGPVPPPP